MAWIKTIDESDATGELRDVYERIFRKHWEDRLMSLWVKKRRAWLIRV